MRVGRLGWKRSRGSEGASDGGKKGRKGDERKLETWREKNTGHFVIILFLFF